MKTEDKIVLAADDLELEHVFGLVKKIGNRIFGVKIHNLFDWYGPAIINDLRAVGAKRLWVDFKLHDIPNTVKLRAQALAAAGCDIVTAHASGGVKMMQSAKEGFGLGKVYAVSALTSLSDEDVQKVYNAKNAADLVMRLAGLAKEAKVDGLVCSPAEIGMIRSNPDFASLDLIVPGIRSKGVETNDQQRIDTPENALKSGANLLVIGRQITQAQDPVLALDNIEEEIKNV